jgi:hypothetical protein
MAENPSPTYLLILQAYLKRIKGKLIKNHITD